MIIGCVCVCAPSVCCIVETLGEVRGRPTKKGGLRGHAFLVIIKLDPMATVPDTASARPMYLSSSMVDLWEVKK